jgi:hypothetical protein
MCATISSRAASIPDPLSRGILSFPGRSDPTAPRLLGSGGLDGGLELRWSSIAIVCAVGGARVDALAGSIGTRPRLAHRYVRLSWNQRCATSKFVSKIPWYLNFCLEGVYIQQGRKRTTEHRPREGGGAPNNRFHPNRCRSRLSRPKMCDTQIRIKNT